jgi:dihydrofolate reductase
MRKVNVLEFVSLDGVIQAPGGPEEDTSGGFAYGGWISPHSDPVLSTAIRKQMNMPFDLLIGRRTFDIWAPYWPQHNDIWPASSTANVMELSYDISAKPNSGTRRDAYDGTWIAYALHR